MHVISYHTVNGVNLIIISSWVELENLTNQSIHVCACGFLMWLPDTVGVKKTLRFRPVPFFVRSIPFRSVCFRPFNSGRARLGLRLG